MQRRRRSVVALARVTGEAERVQDTLRALRLDPSLSRDTWAATHAALVAHYDLARGSADIERDRAFALSDDDDEDAPAVRDLLERWLGEAFPADAGSPVTHAADLLLIRDRHGAGGPDRGPQLFRLDGEAGSLFVVRTWAERDAARGAEYFATCHYPDTESALSGVYRYEGARPSFIAHAPGCALCQQQLRDVITRYGRQSVTADFLALLR